MLWVIINVGYFFMSYNFDGQLGSIKAISFKNLFFFFFGWGFESKHFVFCLVS